MANTTFGSHQTATVNDTTLAYREQGSGEPVVLVHGTSCDLRIWEHQVGALADSYRAIAYSRRYARPNADIPPDVDDQMMPHVDDLAAFLSAVDAAPAHLIGSSWGGFISLLVAIRHPELVQSLVLMEPPVMPLFVGAPPSGGKLLRLLFTRPRTAWAFLQFGSGAQKAQAAFKQGQDEEAMKIFNEAVSGPGAWEQLPDAMREMIRENVAAARAQLLGAGFPPLDDKDVRAVQVPTLLLRGVHSPAFLRLASDRLKDLIPTATQIDIEDASHTMQVDNPDVVNRVVLDFLGRHGSNHD